MIRVVITGPSWKGYFPYRVEGGPEPLYGLSDSPLLDACRTLKRMDEALAASGVGLFDEDRFRDEYRLKTTVGYGASVRVSNRGFKKDWAADGQAPEAVEAG